jgi:hypothetical protein
VEVPCYTEDRGRRNGSHSIGGQPVPGMGNGAWAPGGKSETVHFDKCNYSRIGRRVRKYTCAVTGGEETACHRHT